MTDCKPVHTPMDQNFDHYSLLRPKSESPELENTCRKIIGCVMYAILGSRPDMCASISILSRYQSCASTELLTCLKRVLRYIKGTLDLKLVYKRNDCNQINVKGFTDADWAGDNTDRKSTSGFCFKIFNCTVSWASKKQNCVSLSATEAEYVSLSQSTCEACWLKNLLNEIGVCEVEKPVVIYEDNQSSIKISSSIEQPKRLKHIDVKHHFIKEKVKNKTIELKYIPTQKQIADILTKPLNKCPFEKLRNLIRT